MSRVAGLTAPPPPLVLFAGAAVTDAVADAVATAPPAPVQLIERVVSAVNAPLD
jgi:hypothetical protein